MDSTRTDTIQITAAGSKRQLDTLISAPAAIHDDATKRAAPLRFDQKQQLTEKNPFFPHARWQASISEECVLLVKGFESPPYCMTGHTRPWYGDHAEATGSRKSMDLLANGTNLEFERPRTMRNISESMGSQQSRRYRNDEKKPGPA